MLFAVLSTVTTFVESASGVAEGGRTGLTSIVAGILFALSLLLSPIFLAIPSFATAPALIVVGYLMLTSVTKIDFSDMTEAIPCFIAIIAMPFMYSISEGISMGVISYVVIQSDYRKGKRKEDQCADVRSCHIICTEIYFHLILTRMRSDSVKKMSAYADLNHAPGLTDVRT